MDYKVISILGVKLRIVIRYSVDEENKFTHKMIVFHPIEKYAWSNEFQNMNTDILNFIKGFEYKFFENDKGFLFIKTKNKKLYKFFFTNLKKKPFFFLQKKNSLRSIQNSN